jgi:hypothetical protein
MWGGVDIRCPYESLFPNSDHPCPGDNARSMTYLIEANISFEGCARIHIFEQSRISGAEDTLFI